jgi:hypothetical protein
MALGSGVGRCAFCTEPPEDVLHVDDGVIDELADRHGEAPERHRVDPDPEPFQDEDGRDEGERDRGEADERRADVPEEQEQDNRHHDAALDEGGLDVADGALDEVGLAEGRGVDAYVRRQARAQGGEGLLDPVSPRGCWRAAASEWWPPRPGLR